MCTHIKVILHEKIHPTINHIIPTSWLMNQRMCNSGFFCHLSFFYFFFCSANISISDRADGIKHIIQCNGLFRCNILYDNIMSFSLCVFDVLAKLAWFGRLPYTYYYMYGVWRMPFSMEYAMWYVRFLLLTLLPHSFRIINKLQQRQQ